MITACNTPFKLPKRLSRARRHAEAKRLESFKDIQESLKKTARSEKQLLDEFAEKVKQLWDDDTDDENNVEIM